MPNILVDAGEISKEHELSLSRFVSCLLLVVYLVFVYFQLVSHTELFEEDEKDEEKVLVSHSSCLPSKKSYNYFPAR